MVIVKSTVNGAISIVNAIATGKGATVGITKKVHAIVEATEGKGITIEVDKKKISSRLIASVVERIIPKSSLNKTKLRIELESDIPTGYGLKSSSAISSAVSLACSRIFRPTMTDEQILKAGIDASIETKVSITGAYDDACACYYGGFIITDNFKRKIIVKKKCPNNIQAVIFIPAKRKRGNVKKLKMLKQTFQTAWDIAKNEDYWNAMTINGLATSTILDSEPKIIPALIDKGALGASISGNGPSIAAVGKKGEIKKIENVFDEMEGNVIIADMNNKKADVNEM